MLPEVLEYCMEPPEKIALELENFYNLPYRGKPPYYALSVFKNKELWWDQIKIFIPNLL